MKHMKHMKHIQLFEAWHQATDSQSWEISANPLESLAMRAIASTVQDPEMQEYQFSASSIDADDPNHIFIKWDNPKESQRWRESGYGESFGPDDEVPAMNVLALVMDNETPYCYILTPEEKYYGVIYTDDEEGYEKDQLMPCNSYEDFKAALEESIWGDF